MLKIISLALALVLTGCANKEYLLYAETQQKVAQAQAMSDAAKYAALAEIAKQGDSTAKVAAVMSINMLGGGGTANRGQQIAAPESWSDSALRWTSLFLPIATQLYSVNVNRQIAVTQSNNAAATAANTNKAFTDIAASGFNAMSTTATSGFTALNNTANSGFNANVGIATAGFNALNSTSTAGFSALNNTSTAGFNALNSTSTAGFGALNTTATTGLNVVGSTSTSGFKSLSDVANAGFNAATAIASKIQTPQPNVTTTIGRDNNTGASSGNAGRLVGGNLTENTATPTVVTQPEPIVVTQPTPVIVRP